MEGATITDIQKRKNETAIKLFSTKHFELPLAIFTSIGVMTMVYFLWPDNQANYIPLTWVNQILFSFTFVAFNFGFWLCNSKQRLAGLLISTLAVVALTVNFQYGINGILAIIITAQLPNFFKYRQACILALAFPLFGALSDEFINHRPYAYLNAILYATFNFFALFTSIRMINERQLKEKSAVLVRELKATQILLNTTAKREERLRIGRDLHDLVGHQLTALSLQLEVASHVKQQEVQDHVQRAKAISSLLLDDVRQSVYEIRQKKELDLRKALKALTQDIPGLQVILNIVADESQIDARQAEAIFRCVQEALTNTIKHAKANRIDILLASDDEKLTLSIEDNGVSKNFITPGNGLSGMKERVEKIDGQVDWKHSNDGFRLDITLPHF